jgi:peptide deformylase
VQAGDPVLRGVARPLTREEIASPGFAELVAIMRETMRAAPGVGLAAPQIGLPIQLVVIEDRADYLARSTPEELAARDRRAVDFHVLVNPRLTIVDAAPAEFFEGCLSVEGYLAKVARATAVHVDALDEQGRPVAIDARGWYARILQHEVDHLNGTLYIDRMTPRTLTAQENYPRFWAR